MMNENRLHAFNLFRSPTRNRTLLPRAKILCIYPLCYRAKNKNIYPFPSRLWLQWCIYHVISWIKFQHSEPTHTTYNKQSTPWRVYKAFQPLMSSDDSGFNLYYLSSVDVFCAGGGIRTPNPQINSLLLYQLELHQLIIFYNFNNFFWRNNHTLLHDFFYSFFCIS